MASTRLRRYTWRVPLSVNSVRPMRQGASRETSMRRPSSCHQRGVNRLSCPRGSAPSASTRARFDAATALCAMLSTLSALDEFKRLQPQLGAERAPQLPGVICLSAGMLAHERVERGLRKEVTALAPRIAQQVERV